MIIDFISGAIGAVLGLVFNALPSFSISSHLNGADSYGTSAGHYLALINGIFPISEVLTLLAYSYGILLPALLLYKAANWIWRHIPDLWGFGPGSG